MVAVGALLVPGSGGVADALLTAAIVVTLLSGARYAVRSDALFVSAGKGALDAIKEAIQMPPDAGKKLLYYEVKLGPILKSALAIRPPW